MSETSDHEEDERLLEDEEEQEEVDDQLGASNGLLGSGGDPEKKTGVVYLSVIPPHFSATKLRTVLSNFGEIGRVYLQADKKTPGKGRKYTEGWVEFKKKRVAKDTAARLNNQKVGGKRRSPAYDSLWSMKYLNGFKWSHLLEQLNYERRVEEQRMRIEINQAKRQARHFIEQVEKGEKIKQLEAKVLAKGGTWKREEKRTVKQRPTRKAKKEADGKKKRPTALNDGEQAGLLHLIFDKKKAD